jgi:hypothetical protein
MLNLHFFNPYLKNSNALFSYHLLMRIFNSNSEEDNNRFISKVIDFLAEFKRNLYEHMEEGVEQIEKILPLFHVLIYLFTYYKFTDKEKMKNLA